MGTLLTAILSGATGMTEIHHADLFIKGLLISRASSHQLPDAWRHKPGVYILLSPTCNGWFSAQVGLTTADFGVQMEHHRKSDFWERALLVAKAGDTPFAPRHVAHLATQIRETLSASVEAEVLNTDMFGDIHLPEREAELVQQVNALLCDILSLVGYRTTPSQNATASTPPVASEEIRKVVNEPRSIPEPLPSEDLPLHSRTAPNPLILVSEEKPQYLTDADLESRLRKWRYQIAKAEGVPAYYIFTDQTLKAIVAQRPITEKQILKVPGFGATKTKKYGPQVAHVVAGTINPA